MINDRLIKKAEEFYRENMENSVASDAFKEWYQEKEEHRKAYAQVYMVKEELIDIPPLQKKPANDQGLGWVGKSFVSGAVAASMLAIFAIFNGFFVPEPVYTQYATDRGEIRDVRLNDGTSLTLAPLSVVQVAAFDDDRRNVILESGEAFFNVAHDKQRPFEITSGDTKIRVLGTSFNVNRAGEHHLSLSLVEGKVEIAQKISDGFIDAFDQYDQVTVNPAERVTVENGALQIPKPENISQMASWRNGTLRYFDEPLSLVISDLNRYSQRQYEIADDRAANLHVTAIFNTDQINDVITGLRETLPISITYRDNGIYIIRYVEKNSI